MKKLMLVLSCSAFLGLHAQTPPDVSSLMKPWESNGYISWNTKTGHTYKVKVYQLKSGNYNQISTTTVLKSKENYFRFSSSELVSTDLFYTISEFNASNVLVGESSPASIGMNPPAIPICFKECNGLREAYRISLMQRSNGSIYLSATDDAGIYYQAIHDINYDQYALSHPYVRFTANGTGNQLTYTRDHIRITTDLPGGPYYDANNAMVQKGHGWLVAKKMDKYSHYNWSTTGDLSSLDFCDANIGNASIIFNNNLNASTMIAPGTSITGDQTYFLSPTPAGSTTYVIPNIPLECSTMANGSGSGPSGPGQNMNDFMDAIDLCFDMATSDSGGTQLECLIPDGPISGGLGGTISGVTFESMNANFNYRLSVENSNGRTGVLSETGEFEPGLYRINTFLTNGNIIPTYRVLGKPSTAVAPAITITIAPNPIVSNKLKFNVTTNRSVVATVLVQKLDGTTLYTESVSLVKNIAFNKEVDAIGDVPYNQLRVSVILADGTVIQQTALTQ